MSSENVSGAGWRFLGDVRQVHVRFLHFTPTFAVVAGGTGCHEVRPVVLSAHVTWDDVVYG
jgi:hypothetical protein